MRATIKKTFISTFLLMVLSVFISGCSDENGFADMAKEKLTKQGYEYYYMWEHLVDEEPLILAAKEVLDDGTAMDCDIYTFKGDDLILLGSAEGTELEYPVKIASEGLYMGNPEMISLYEFSADNDEIKMFLVEKADSGEDLERMRLNYSQAHPVYFE